MPKFEVNLENIYYYEPDVGDFIEVLPNDVISGEWSDISVTSKKYNGEPNRLAEIIVTEEFQEKYELELNSIFVLEEEKIASEDDTYDNSEALYYLITPD